MQVIQGKMWRKCFFSNTLRTSDPEWSSPLLHVRALFPSHHSWKLSSVPEATLLLRAVVKEAGRSLSLPLHLPSTLTPLPPPKPQSLLLPPQGLPAPYCTPEAISSLHI